MPMTRPAFGLWAAVDALIGIGPTAASFAARTNRTDSIGTGRDCSVTEKSAAPSESIDRPRVSSTIASSVVGPLEESGIGGGAAAPNARASARTSRMGSARYAKADEFLDWL